VTGCDVTDDVIGDGGEDHECQLHVAAGTQEQGDGGERHEAGYGPVVNDYGRT